MTTENKYFRELTLNLQRAGFTVGPDNLLPVELDGERLCVATEGGSIRYRKEDVASEARTEALDKVIDIAGVTAEYLREHMCMTMVWNMMVPGIIVGIIGIVLLLCLIPICKGLK